MLGRCSLQQALAAQLIVGQVHGTLHFGEHPLLLSFGDAPKTHSISRHAHGETLFEATLLAAVAIDSDDGAVLIFQTPFVLDVLLDAPTEKALAALTGVHAIVEARSNIPTHFTQQHHAVQLSDVTGTLTGRHSTAVFQSHLQTPWRAPIIERGRGG